MLLKQNINTYLEVRREFRNEQDEEYTGGNTGILCRLTPTES